MANNSGPMAQGPSSPSLSHDWADDKDFHGVTSKNSVTPLTQVETEESGHSELSPVDRIKTSSSVQKTRSNLGLHPQAPIDPDHDRHQASDLLWSRIRIVLREPFLEFWGVAVMVSEVSRTE